jgi:hypothetical protein
MRYCRLQVVPKYCIRHGVLSVPEILMHHPFLGNSRHFEVSKVIVGIHALINVHEYHSIAIRMRCWLVDDWFYSLLQC